MNAIFSECAPTLDPGAGVLLRVEGTGEGGVPVSVMIAFPASGVQSLRRDLRIALMALPIEIRQENG